MDRRERFSDLPNSFLAALVGWQAEIYTSCPGIVQSVDYDNDTCVVQPAIQALFTSPVDGSQKWITMPVLVDCPILLLGGGGVTLTFPFAEGDECLIHFSQRCIDAWWQSGGVQPQALLRMHDLSDGFVIPGFRSQPRKMTFNSTTAQLRTDDGNAYVEVDPVTHNVNVVTTGNVNVTATGNVNVTATGNVVAQGDQVNATAVTSGTLTAPTINLIGNVNVTGNLTINGGFSQTGGTSLAQFAGDIVINGRQFMTHEHYNGSGSGGGTTAGVV